MKQRLKLARQTVGVRAALAFVVVAAAVIVVAHRLPAALDGLRNERAADVGRNEAGGALAAADGAQIDNDFVRAAIATVRPPERYAVLYPSIEVAQATYHVSPLTLQVLPMLMREVLLPARDIATPSRGTYLLCYLCDTSPWDHRTRWLWNSDRGIAIGKVYR